MVCYWFTWWGSHGSPVRFSEASFNVVVASAASSPNTPINQRDVCGALECVASSIALYTLMLPQSVVLRKLYVQQSCYHALRSPDSALGAHRLRLSTRCQDSRDPRSFRRHARAFDSGSPQNSESFADSAQDKAQAASKEASKR